MSNAQIVLIDIIAMSHFLLQIKIDNGNKQWKFLMAHLLESEFVGLKLPITLKLNHIHSSIYLKINSYNSQVLFIIAISLIMKIMKWWDLLFFNLLHSSSQTILLQKVLNMNYACNLNLMNGRISPIASIKLKNAQKIDD